MGHATIFGETGASVRTLNSTSTAFVVLADQLLNVVLATAPMTSIKITESVDHSIAKSLDKTGYLITAFGDRPVSISITGLIIYKVSCLDINTTQAALSIHKFYKDNRISADTKKRVTVSIGTGKTARVFTCALVSMISGTKEDTDVCGYGAYTLELIGVEKSAEKPTGAEKAGVEK